MTHKNQYKLFLELFPWMEHEIAGYKTNRKDGGIDIYTKDEKSLHFKVDKNGWILTGEGHL